MKSLLISACLIGENTKYNGKNNYTSEVEKLRDFFTFIPICPEVFGGLSTPRDPSEILDFKVISNKGVDVTDNYNKGSNKALSLAIKNNAQYALLKEKSPSCGVHKVYDGTFTSNLIDGEGITTKLLRKHGIKVYNENEIDELLEEIKSKS